MESPKAYTRIVVKIGSSLIPARDNVIDTSYLSSIVDQIHTLLDSEAKEVVVVSSGAVACGMSLLGLKKRPRDVARLQAAAATGQSELMAIYRRLLGKKDRLCAQLLLTRGDFEHRDRFLNVRNTIFTLLEKGVIPIVNENDTVSTEEIGFGDNDMLSGLVATLIGADVLLILSDVDGLYKWPRKEPISYVERITTELEEYCIGSGKGTTVGGMSSKLAAIKLLTASGISCVIANGRAKNVLLKVARKQLIGTVFLPQGPNVPARKRWIAGSVRVKGTIIVDDGAKQALISRNGSLLSVGITDVRGEFAADDIVGIAGTDGVEFARGQVAFSAAELKDLKGKRVKQRVIHRNDMAIL